MTYNYILKNTICPTYQQIFSEMIKNLAKDKDLNYKDHIIGTIQQGANIITTTWLEGKKTSRTGLLLSYFPTYKVRKNDLQNAILLDSFINIIDSVLDNENTNRELELLHTGSILANIQNITPKIMHSFAKIVQSAIYENILKSRIRQKASIKLFWQYYHLRALDIYFFVQILFQIYDKKLISQFQIWRSLTLILDDLIDYKEDLKHNQSPVLYYYLDDFANIHNYLKKYVKNNIHNTHIKTAANDILILLENRYVK